MSDSSASGRFVLRIDPGLHAALRAAARAQGVSLNEYCATRLATPIGDLHAFGGAAEAVRRAAAVLGDALVGIVAFGSWARGELADSSDIDLLVVADEPVPITRALYRTWDEAPVVWNGHAVEPHFVRMPVAAQAISGLWAEVALDGIVIFERDLRVAVHLAHLRRALASGRLRRGEVHGQGYWAQVA
jgi:hypothetical protein